MKKENIGRIFYVLYFSLFIFLTYLNFNSNINIGHKILIFGVGIIGIGVLIFLLILSIYHDFGNRDICDIIEEDFKTIKQQTINIIKFYLNI
jgi:hypothetical protein